MRTPARHDLLLASALLLALLLCPWRDAAWAQVSPGPLSAPHASIDGTTQCFQCHASGSSKSGMDARCLACHTDIGWMKARNRGFHAPLGPKECASCHPDHGGRAFQLVVWDTGAPEKFDHRRAGFVLVGKHATLECRSCHKPALQKSGAAPLIRKKDRAASWLGLETACASCHADPHRGQLGTTCTSCHGQNAWKPAAGFDHARSAFPLTGEHAKVECAKCHATAAVATARDAKGEPIPQWKPLPHGDCVSCHKDPHSGRFPGACSKCHVTAGWHQIGKQNFNHDLTRYPLRGKHAAVACTSCHDPKKPGSDKPKFARCTDCHQDAHAGKATLLGEAVDCAACHTVEGFDRPTYTVEAHTRSKYPLLGRHAAAACEKCHVTLASTPAVVAGWGKSRVVMRPIHATCASCHADPHRGRFEPAGVRPHKESCLFCHGMDTFHPSKYDGALHLTCVFPLQGAHRAVPCQACHEELKAPASGASLLADSSRLRPLHFDNPRRLCADCHANPHGDQFAHRRDKGACDGCHDDAAFAPAPKFDHNRDARYKLEGAHLKTPCASCHVPHRQADGHNAAIYRPLSSRCEGCHAGGVRDTMRTQQGSGRSSFVPARSDAHGAAWLAYQEVDRVSIH